MEARDSLGVPLTRQPVNVGLDHAVAVRTGPPEAARGLSRVNAAPGVDQERRLGSLLINLGQVINLDQVITSSPLQRRSV